MVDLYYALYGIKRPPCLPMPELSSMFKPQKVQSSLSTIPTITNIKTEVKPKISDIIDVKPIDIEPMPLLQDDIISMDIEDEPPPPIVEIPLLEPPPQQLPPIPITQDIKHSPLSFEHSIDIKMEPEDVKIIKVNVYLETT